MSVSQPQRFSLIITPMITGTISTVASATIIVSIFRSQVKLNSIYRRFIFGMSSFDVIQSFSQLLSSLPMPANDTIWGSVGNDITCEMQGFFIVLGFCGAVLYSLSLTIYFLLVVKYEITEAKIKKKYERLLHAFPILYAFSIGIGIYVTHNYNPNGTACWIAARPTNCHNDPEIPCESYGNFELMRWLAAGIPIFAVGSINIILLGMILWTMRSKIKRSQDRRLSWATTTRNSQQTDQQQGGRGSMCQVAIKYWNKVLRRKDNRRATTNPTSVLAARLSRPSQAEINRMKEISYRAIFYIISFFFAFIFSAIHRLMEVYSSSVPPFTIILLARLFYPLQGFFNILVYTYPHVQSYRRNHSEVSYFRAFVQVIKSGGDSDQIRTIAGRPGRRQSLRRQQRVLEQSENQRRRHSMTSQAPHRHNEENVTIGFRATGLGEEAKIDIDEEQMEEEEKLIESLYAIKPKDESLADRCRVSIGSPRLEMSDDVILYSASADDDSSAAGSEGSEGSEVADNDTLYNDGEDWLAGDIEESV